MQKTAYEMRIIDCSSDVCSSDLGAPDGAVAVRARDRRRGELWLFAWRRADGRQRLLAQGPGSYRGRAERHRRGAALSAGFLSDQSPSRIATDRAWAGRPSARARLTAAGPILPSDSGGQARKLVRFMKTAAD